MKKRNACISLIVSFILLFEMFPFNLVLAKGLGGKVSGLKEVKTVSFEKEKKKPEVTEIIVKYKKEKLYKLESKNYLSKTDKTMGIDKIKIGKGESASNLINKYKNDPDVEYSQPNYIYSAADINDTYRPLQWGLDVIEAAAGWGWSGTMGQGVKVAVVDTGVDLDHEDLRGNIIGGFNSIDGTSYDDNNGHGTHVAGIIAALPNNGLGVAGVAGNAKILAVKGLDSEGSGTSASIAQGIVWAADNGANIINLSLSSSEQDQLMKDAVDYAYNKGCTIVAAAGNDYMNSVSYPAAYPNVIAVGAVNESNGLADFSNYGPEIDVVAPGVNIASTMPNHSTTEGILDYGYMSGTSMAAPFVAGLAAILKSQNPSYTPLQIKQAMETKAYELGIAGPDVMYGNGLVNANKAVGGTSSGLIRKVTGDSGEDNNGPLSAKVITGTTSINFSIYPDSDTDWYKLIVPKNTVASLFLKSPTAAIAPSMLLFNEGNFNDIVDLKMNGVNFVIPQAEVDKTYFINVLDINGASDIRNYKLDIVYDSFEPNNSLDSAVNLTLGQTKNGSALNSESDVDYYKVSVTGSSSLTVAAGSTPFIKAQVDILDSQGNLVAGKRADAIGQAVSFSADVVTGDYYIKYSAAEFTSPYQSGNYSLTVSGGQDLSAPVIVSSNPSNYGNALPDSSITVTFNEGLDSTRVNTSNVFLKSVDNESVGISVYYDNSKRQITAVPAAPLSLKDYVLTIKGGAAGVRDNFGNYSAGDYFINFKVSLLDSWTSLRKDSGNTGYTNEDLIYPLKTKWTASISYLKPENALVNEDTIYVYSGSTTGRLNSVDKSTGTVKWYFDGLSNGSIVSDAKGNIYVNKGQVIYSLRDEGSTYSVNWSKNLNYQAINVFGDYLYLLVDYKFVKLGLDGTVIWEKQFLQVPAKGNVPPVINNGVVVVQLATNEIIALNDATGSELWTSKSSVSHSEYSPGPIAKNGMLVFQTGTNYSYQLSAVNITTGKLIWEYPMYHYQGNHMAVDSKNIYVIQNGPESDSVTAIDFATGKLVWKENLESSYENTYISIARDKLLFAGRGTMYVMSTDGRLLYHKNLTPTDSYIESIIPSNKELFYFYGGGIMSMEEGTEEVINVASVYPSNNQKDVGLNDKIVFKFSRYVDPSTIRDLIRVTDASGNAVQGSLEVQSQVKHKYGIVFVPANRLNPNQKYTVTLGAAPGLPGGDPTGWPGTNYSFSFTTGRIDLSWNNYHGDSGNTGVYKYVKPPTKIAWQKSLNVSQATPVYSNNSLYFIDDSFAYVLYAVNSGNGTDKWKINNVSPATPAVDDRNNIYFGMDNQLVSIRDNGSGYTINWAYPMKVEGVNIRGNRLYVTGNNGTAAFDLSGNLLWRNNAAAGIAAPTVSDSKVYVKTGTSGVCALDINTGGLSWSKTVGIESYGRVVPVVKDGIVYISNERYQSGSLLAVDEESGNVIWEKAAKVKGTPIVDGDTIYYSMEQGTDSFINTVVALDRITGEYKWGVNVGYSYNSPIKAGSFIYIKDQNGTLSVISEDGALIRQILPGTNSMDHAHGSLTAGDGKIYAGAEYRLIAYGTDIYSPDVTAPEIVNTNISNNGYMNFENLEIDLYDDSAIALESILVKVDGKVVEHSFDEAYNRITVPSQLVEGAYTLFLSVKDIYGNQLNKNLSFSVDVSGPIIAITGVEDEGEYPGPVTPIISVDEGQFTALLNGEEFNSGTTIDKAGEYILTVIAVDDLGNYSSATIGFKINPPAASLPDIIVSPNMYTSMEYAITGMGTSPNGLLYKFVMEKASTGIQTVLQDYSENKVINWTPSSPGSYKVTLYIKDRLSTRSFDSYTSKNIEVQQLPPASITEFNLSEIFYSGKTGTISGRGTAVNRVLYEFWVKDNSTGANTRVQNYSTIDTFNWTPQNAGNFRIEMRIKDEFSKQSYDAVAFRDVEVKDPTRAFNASIDMETNLSLGSTYSAKGYGSSYGRVLYQFWVKDYSTGAWSLKKDYSESSVFSWKPEKAGSYRVELHIKDAYSSREFDANAFVDVTVKAPTATISSAAIEPNMIINRQYSISASGTSTNKILYQFWMNDRSTGRWSLLRDYSENSSYSWTPVKTGSYRIEIHAKDSASLREFDDLIFKDVTVQTSPPAVVSTFLLPDSFTAGKTYQFVSSGTSENAVLYQYWLKDYSTGAWSLLRDYGSDGTYSWTPVKSGSYRVELHVKDSYSTRDFDSIAYRDITVQAAPTAPPAVITSFELPSSFIAGKTYQLVSSGTGSNKVLYQYWLKDYGTGRWSLLSDYSENGTYSWTPAKAGNYRIELHVKDVLSLREFDNISFRDVTVNSAPPASISSLTFSENTMFASKAYTITGSGSSQNGVLYQFWAKDYTTGRWQLLRDYSTSSSYSWTPSRSGSYRIEVHVKDKNSSSEFEGLIYKDLQVYEAAMARNAALTLPSGFTAGASSTITGSGSSSNKVLYQLWVKDYSIGQWQLVSDYSENNSFTWKPLKPGNYRIELHIKDIYSGREFDDLYFSDITVN